MSTLLCRRSALAVAALFVLLPFVQAQSSGSGSSTAGLPSEMPDAVHVSADGFDYVRREVMITMRDGVKLHTVILVPKGAKGAGILLTRTPYNANALTTNALSSHMGSSLYGYDNATDVIIEGGYIRVIQDVRGKYGSEGDYVMNRPLRGPLNPTQVDHATDTYDTIDWLVKNTPESNGKVGIIGISYDGFTTLMGLVNPHPALKVAVPMNPMVDGWMGDDWFHHGAFREQNMSYIYEQDGSRSNEARWWTSTFDDYDMFMRVGSAGELGRERGLEQMGFWRKVIAHPSYDSFWKDQAVDKILAAQPVTVPTLLVSSLWDAEDIYGAMAVYKAIKPKDTANDKVFLAMGPWHHGQGIEDGSTLGTIKFNSDTSLYFRENILAPFLAKYLKDDASAPAIAPVSAYETGTNTWRKLASWPTTCTSGCTAATPIYLKADGKLGFVAAAAGDKQFEEYTSDPARPVPFRARPIQPVGYDNGMTWPNWLADDQREASGRPDVAVFTSEVLTAPVKISGQPVANLVASTSGTDSDWVVKVIDVYPDQVAGQPKMGGYQLMISADIFRGRYRESLEKATPIAAGKALVYRFDLPNANHVFLPGHRIMVQVQSSWFPLYDRNPQTFVPNVFWAKPEDYKKAVQRIYDAPGQASYIALPVVANP
jgi:putative CocE/NonD family hydrolase